MYDFDDNEYPLAYLITVRCYGTWLHGDERQSVDRHGLNIYGFPRRPASEHLQTLMRENMQQPAVFLADEQRATVKAAIRSVCEHRSYKLWAVNVLTSHFHVVVTAQSKPEAVADAFKSYATRSLRLSGLIGSEIHPWARGRSRRYLWKPEHVSRAIHYVLYEQGEPPNFDD